MIQGSLSYKLRSCALDVVLTLAVAALDIFGGLGAFENWLYDKRALHFQHFISAPTDRLVHLDIDDAALETIGRWPWPRGTQADIINEVRLAGAELLALDIVLSDEDGGGAARRNGTEKLDNDDGDARLADAIERFGRVLVPVSFTYVRRTPGVDGGAATRPDAVAALRDD